jgi:hypothetical protein
MNRHSLPIMPSFYPLVQGTSVRMAGFEQELNWLSPECKLDVAIMIISSKRCILIF